MCTTSQKFQAVVSLIVPPLIMGYALGTTIWTLAWGLSSANDASKTRDINDISLAIKYLSVSCIETFGIVAVYRRSPVALKIFTQLSFLAAALIVTTEYSRISTFADRKDALIHNCVLKTAGKPSHTLLSRCGLASKSAPLTLAQAQKWCGDKHARTFQASYFSLAFTTVVNIAFFALTCFMSHRLAQGDSMTCPQHPVVHNLTEESIPAHEEKEVLLRNEKTEV